VATVLNEGLCSIHSISVIEGTLPLDFWFLHGRRSGETLQGQLNLDVLLPGS